MDTGGVGGRRRGFFASLLDFSFTNFITGRIISILYGISLVLVVIYALIVAGQVAILSGAFLAASSGSGALGWLVGIPLFLVLAALILLLGAIYVRVLLEIVIVLFRILENTSEMAAGLRDGPRNSQQTTEAPSAPLDNSGG